ncbi:3-mercaptopyruvate sulfurtransferase [Rhodoblastus acidophilus]|uniref:3-mercaptopyruvate sulfurtransferase n=1 Tax=Candidatus Rhodoblastus alkanivorans TaxID=2954117 RepID=A0ABS9Z872_9HYPH|nr:3-mercaptopyruvate sulfurtransferase [Candidatus Rhodoblastus alkanivorans]MCI4679577.1 3-mercaptopyruvate sulfurtransferase [Candidatus Rhodoblastus alkanivorans]MCI4683402.1 3-mercaptopyruvate sulfurtransferase [Candidatus Rhodoblastus alkanivorans]MDI4640712.1 3-mercaptopyruvate sulfurtransferase [Rhodoblastus acidophilus]
MAGLNDNHFVSTDWLAEHLGAPGIAIVDASWHLSAANRNGADEFLARHIPGAVYFDIDAIADRTSDLPHMLPDPVAFSSAMRALGIGDGMRIVVYDSLGLFSAPRVWWTFRVFGKRDVVILDGGLPKWMAEGRPLAEGGVTPQPRHFTCRLDHTLVASRDDMMAASAKAGEVGVPQILDARSAARFRGDEPETRPGLRAGHIPGSRNLPWESLLAEGRLKPAPELDAAFAEAGVDLSRPIVTTCGSGVTASLLALALAVLGRDATPVYDGSWCDWGARADLPLARGPA